MLLQLLTATHTHTNYFGSSLWSLVSYDEMLSRVNVCEIFAYMLYFSSSRRRSRRCCVRVCVCVVVGFHSCSVLLWCVLFCSVFMLKSVLFLCCFCAVFCYLSNLTRFNVIAMILFYIVFILVRNRCITRSLARR